jgi:AcrR family transcriptional regulator
MNLENAHGRNSRDVEAMLRRPPTRSEEDTMRLIVEAADREFMSNGYGRRTSRRWPRAQADRRRRSYKLVPTKAELFEAVIRHRISHFLLNVGDVVTDDLVGGTGAHPVRLRRADAEC